MDGGKLPADITEAGLRFNCLFGFGPVFPDSHVDGKPASGERVFHRVANDVAQGFHFGLRTFENEFVVDLHDHAAFESCFFDVFSHGDHGALHDVGGGSLYRHVGRFAFGALADILVGIVKSLDEAFATEGGFHVSGRAGLFEHGVVVRADSRIPAEERLDVSGCLRGARSDGFGKAETGDSIDDSEVYRLRYAALVFGNGRGFRKEEFRRFGMDVAAVFERREERRVT